MLEDHGLLARRVGVDRSNGVAVLEEGGACVEVVRADLREGRLGGRVALLGSGLERVKAAKGDAAGEGNSGQRRRDFRSYNWTQERVGCALSIARR